MTISPYFHSSLVKVPMLVHGINRISCKIGLNNNITYTLYTTVVQFYNGLRLLLVFTSISVFLRFFSKNLFFVNFFAGLSNVLSIPSLNSPFDDFRITNVK
jgi:hypothetical protein